MENMQPDVRVLRVKTKDVTMVTSVLDSPRGFLCELPRIVRVEFPKGILVALMNLLVHGGSPSFTKG